MGKITNIDDASINTEKIISVFQDHATKVLVREPTLVMEAITSLQKHLSHPTPKWKVEPKYDGMGKEIQHGIPQETLWQFDPANMADFEKSANVIDMAMSVIPSVIIDCRRQLKEHHEVGSPMMVPYQVNPNPPPLSKPSILDRINPFQKPKEARDEEDIEMLSYMKQVKEIQMRWMRFKEWWYGSYKYPEYRVTWSDLHSRSGMEHMLGVYQQFFNYWIVSLFLSTYKYAIDLEFKQHVKNDVKEFVHSLARVQSEHEKQPPMN